ncbi:hypothetical protein BDW59DRAFT_19247 [Aspergillus cavernicola]|uniref:Uncharacterized protein n=1 Tax=Aspergillus cavernicola TaxID=176166 RepID=A0ABR4IUU3_9EURO
MRSKTLYVKVSSRVSKQQKVSQDELIARALLQACGFTDYDYVQEHRRPTFPSLGPAPQVDSQFTGIYEAIQCSECRSCIRSFHFYECKTGCPDYPIHRNHIKTIPEKAQPQLLEHIFLDSMGPTPYRLCCNCMETSSHPNDHLEIAYKFKKAGDIDSHVFSRELDALEDHIKGQGLLSFGNAFLDHISVGGLRRSMNSRQLFPAGNAHCALMFGPLIIENGMTIHPGGALISSRALPSLGRHSPREVKEYLRQEDYRTLQGCDVFCTQVYSVSSSRHVYTAMKRARERRFLCSRKQLSGGLFTDYNHSRPMWKLGEKNLIQFFLRLASIWRDEKAPTGHENNNRTLLQKCAEQLTNMLQSFFSDDINSHLFLLAQKLGKTQKLTYSRMSNNCQDFCNGLLNYDKYYYPMFNAVYPFIPVSLSPEIEQEPDDRCLSYLQSFVKPLQYPIPGSSQRAMIGSAVTMYSSYAQNDADLIDHVYSVRFGVEQGDGFSLGLRLSNSGGDPYLLKDEEMSCSDRFAAEQSPGQAGQNHSCSLADHLLDCPVDNLSVLQTHMHRQKKYYTDGDRQFLATQGPAAWMTNRPQILRRLKLLNDFLAEIAGHFQECCRMLLPKVGVVNVKALRKIWRPGGTVFSRAWHMDKRDRDTLHYAPDIDFGDGEMSNWKSVGFFTFGTTFAQTHRQMISGDELFMTRLKTMKSLLESRQAGREDAWSPWEWCTCDLCKIHRLKSRCHRVDCNALDNEKTLGRGETPAIKPGHPDYVSPSEVERLLRDQVFWESVVEGKQYILTWEKENHGKRGSGWVSTYLLCLRLVFGTDNADAQLLHFRLEEYTRLGQEQREPSR